MNKLLLFSLLICIGLVGCSNEPTKDTASVNKTETVEAEASTEGASDVDFEAVAKDVCNCMGPVVVVMDQIKLLSQQGKLDELKKMGETSQPILNSAEACFKKIESKYGKIENIKDAAFSIALVDNCPDVANLVSKAKELGTIK